MTRFLSIFLPAVVGINLILVAFNQGRDIPVWYIALISIPVALVSTTAMLAISLGAVFIHEIGHVVAGSRAGLRFRTMLVGPFVISRQADGKFSFQMTKNPFAGGFAMMDFPADEEISLVKFRRFIAGGPIASLLWCAATLVAFVLAQRFADTHPKNPAGLLAIVASILFLMALAILPGTLWTKPIRGLMTDGYILKRLSTPGPESNRIVALFLLSQSIRAGIRAKFWDGELIKKGLQLRDGGPEELTLCMLSYYHLEDLGKKDGALESLANARDLLPKKDKNPGYSAQGVLFESAYQAALMGDPQTAREWIDRVKTPFGFLEASRSRALAAILVSEGDAAKAMDEISNSRKSLEKLSKVMPGDLQATMESLDSLEASARVSLATS